MDLNNEKTQKGDNLHDINTVYYNITVIKFSGQYIVKCISL